MDKKAIESLLTRIDFDIRSLVGNLEGDAQSAPASALKMSTLITVEHLKVDRQRIEQIRDLLKQE